MYFINTYLCKKANFTTALWISVCLFLRGKEHGNLFGTFVLYSEYSTCWHWQWMCGGEVIYLTFSLVLFLACLQRILSDKSAHFLKMKVTLTFLNYLTVIENKNHKCVWKDITKALKSAWFLLVLITFRGPISNNKKIHIIWRNNGQAHLWTILNISSGLLVKWDWLELRFLPTLPST